MTLALDSTFKNTSIIVSIRLQIKQLYSKIVSYYNSKSQNVERLSYLTEQVYSIYQASPFLDEFVEESKVGSFGHIYDVLFCSRIVCLNKKLFLNDYFFFRDRKSDIKYK